MTAEVKCLGLFGSLRESWLPVGAAAVSYDGRVVVLCTNSKLYIHSANGELITEWYTVPNVSGWHSGCLSIGGRCSSAQLVTDFVQMIVFTSFPAELLRLCAEYAIEEFIFICHPSRRRIIVHEWEGEIRDQIVWPKARYYHSFRPYRCAVNSIGLFVMDRYNLNYSEYHHNRGNAPIEWLPYGLEDIATTSCGSIYGVSTSMVSRGLLVNERFKVLDWKLPVRDFYGYRLAVANTVVALAELQTDGVNVGSPAKFSVTLRLRNEYGEPLRLLDMALSPGGNFIYVICERRNAVYRFSIDHSIRSESQPLTLVTTPLTEESRIPKKRCQWLWRLTAIAITAVIFEMSLIFLSVNVILTF